MLLNKVIGYLAIGFASLPVRAQHFPVTGVKVAAGADVPLRMNINDLYDNGGPQWDLYLRALKSMQEKDAADPLSYFQISGIHGLPDIEWQNGGPLRATGWRGYCPHGENLFLPWHRPYVLVFEQLLVAEAKKIAATYPGSYRSQYMAAANALRSPFWDWSQDSAVPPCTVPAQMTVNVPDGQNLRQITISNPLRSYSYPQKARDGQFGSFPAYSATARCQAPDQYPQSANERLAQRGLRQSTYDCFTYSRTFDEFVRTREDGIGLEQMHNSVHWDAGCAGQFLDANIAAFDPLFMLHHTHVDRLWAYFNFIRPAQSTFTSSYPGQSRYSTPRNTIITPNSPLQPFYDGSDAYWTPNKVASIRGMGYTYEGLEYWRKSASQLRTDATRLINSLYVPDGARRRRSTRRALAQARTRYFARVELDREQVERPCTIRIFVDGKPAGNVVVMQLPEVGIFRGNLAVDEEVHDAFASAAKSWTSSNGNGNGNGTAAVAAAAAVSAIEHLVQMEIRKPDGAIVPLTSVPSLKLTLEEVSVTPAQSDVEFPKPGRKKTVVAGVRSRQGMGR